MDFPTGGDSFLDNCFTNRPDLFGKTYPIKMLIKTDHLGFIVPAGKKLKPIRQKVQFRDCREHRKRALYLALASGCWDEVLEADNIETAVNILELKILSNINRCMPLRTVTLSSRDPRWMTPLVKYMLRSLASRFYALISIKNLVGGCQRLLAKTEGCFWRARRGAENGGKT